MYETIYYDVVEYGDVLHSRKKRKKEDCIFKRTLDYMFFYSQLQDDFQCSKAEKWHL